MATRQGSGHLGRMPAQGVRKMRRVRDDGVGEKEKEAKKKEESRRWRSSIFF
jgi:hypothetical protein